MIKRGFDVFAATAGILLLLPLFAMVAILIKRDSPGPVFFRQERVGRGFQPFLIWKFRTMVKDAPQRGGPITFAQDPRVTRSGRWLRRTKIDELPQLFNVLKGDMSIVGPRPEVRQYVEIFRKDYERLLSVRPGMTDLASLEYCQEAELLQHADDPEGVYAQKILPEKLRLSAEYLKNQGFWYDLGVIARTLLCIGVR
jgi:lipopolysaccharide/colanic/teichoic acid biosynthesis glycosyltransferase